MQGIKHLILFCGIIFSACLPAKAQTTSIDSLADLLGTAKTDTEKIFLNYEIQNRLLGYDLTKAAQYLERGFQLAQKNKLPFYIAKYYQNKADLLFFQSQYDESLKTCDSAIHLYEELLQPDKLDETYKERCKSDIARLLIRKGSVFSKRYQYEESTGYYLQSIDMFGQIKSSKNNASIATIYADIASNYYELEKYDNALKYDKEALAFLDKNDEIDLFVIGHLFVADDYSGLLQFDSSSVYLEKVRPIVMELNKSNLNIRFYYILGGIYRKKSEWSNALGSFLRANEYAKKIKDDFQVVNSAEGMAASYLHLGDPGKARELTLLVLAESNRLKIPLLKVQALQLLTEIEEKSGDIRKAYYYQKQFIEISDSVKKEKAQRQMHETEVRYESEKKKQEIIRLQKDKQIQSLSLKQKSTLNYFLMGSLAALLLVGFLGFRNLRHRHQLAKQQDELQQQRIRELEKDKQLVAVDSMLKGQEEERSRLAKDLHDGLGGLLSGIKFSLSNMKSNLIVTPDNMAVFERSLDMIDTSIQELRRVAHNMMPEMLIKFGLDEALKEYCITINGTKLIAVKYQSFGLETRLESSTEIIIYRIVQELLNNTMKHAGATEVFVQLVREGNRFNMVVEDNGKGFDTSSVESNTGAGLANIRSRVDYLKGQLDIHAEPGKGTLVNIEFNV